MKLTWTHHWSRHAKGNTLGYSSSNKAIYDALADQGVVFRDDADVAVTYGFGKLYKRIPGKKMVLYTMFESPVLPPEVHEPLRDADLIITPSRWCAEIFEKHTNKPIHVIPLGVDTSKFTFKKRDQRRNRPFRWLYVGAPNWRKVTVLPELVPSFLSRSPNVEMYFKFTGGNKEGIQEMLDNPDVTEISEGLFHSGNIWVDNRLIPTDDLVNLYHWADGVILPTAGEGFGLTGLEAMSTGLAPILTAYSGVLEYADESVARLLKYSFGCMEGENPEGGENISQWLGWPCRKDIIDKITEAMLEDPGVTEEMGRRAHLRAKNFTWEATARDLVHAIRTVVL